MGIITIILLATWAFVGFDVASLDTAFFRFNVKKSRIIVTLSIVCGGLVYALLAPVGFSARPDGYGSYQAYLADLDDLSGYFSVPTFFAAHSSMGKLGLAIIGITAFSAILTGIIAAYRASTRLLLTMAADKIVPKNFLGSTTCVIFVMLISIVFSFFGRNALNRFVDLTSFGAIIGFGYASAAAYKRAKEVGNKAVTVTGMAGLLISAVFFLVHLMSKIGTIETVGKQAFFFLAVWCLLGFVFYWRTVRESSLSDFKGVVTSGTALFVFRFSLLLCGIPRG